MSNAITLSDRGVISLPAALRKAAGLRANDQLIAEMTPEGILLRPAVTLPIEIYTASRIAEFDAEEAALAVAFSKRDSAKTRRQSSKKR